jgi:cyclic pyranopterin phosphate synthase
MRKAHPPTDFGVRPRESRRVDIHIGARCNNRCVFCVSTRERDRREPWAEIADVRRELAHFFRHGCRAVSFVGGEPSVYPGILACISYAKSLGYSKIAICTNGNRFHDPVFCRDAVAAGLTRATISVHSHRSEIEDRHITRIPGNHVRKVAAIRNLVALRKEGLLPDNISLNPVLCRPNLAEMAEYLDYFGNLGINDVRFNYIWPRGAVGKKRAWIPSFREAMPQILSAMLSSERHPRGHLSFGSVPWCTLQLTEVSSRLHRYLAAKYLDEASFDMPNDVSVAREGGAPWDRFEWQELKRDALKVKPPRCARCARGARCDGVWKTYVDLYGVDELQPL